MADDKRESEEDLVGPVTEAAVASISSADTLAADELFHPWAVKARVVAGLMACVTSNLISLLVVAYTGFFVWKDHAWPSLWITGFAFIGPIMTSWQFMGVKGILSTILKNGNFVTDIVAKRYGYSREHKEKKPSNTNEET